MILGYGQQDMAALRARLSALGESERYWRLQRLRQLVVGGRYACRPSFWDTSVPLRERAPAVQSWLARTAINRLAQLVFGDRVFPRLEGEPQVVVDALVEHLRLPRLARRVLVEGLTVGASCVLVRAERGRLCVGLIPPEWCAVELDDRGVVEALVVEHKRLHGDGRLWVHRHEWIPPLERRYAPVPAELAERGAIDWGEIEVREEREIVTVPAVWHRHNAEPIYGHDEIDGHALCEGLEEEIEALDLALSQLYRTALYNGEPQLVRTGIDSHAEDDLPRGRVADSSWLSAAWARVTSAFGRGDAVVKSPQRIWDLPPGADAKMLESSGAGAQIIKSAVDELRRTIVDACGVVLADPSQVGSGELSARALTLMLAPMLAHADDLRVEYGDWLSRMISLGALVAHDAGIALGALEEHGEIHVTSRWGEYFEPSWSEVGAAVNAAQTAAGGRQLVTLEEARALVATVLGISGPASAVVAEEAAVASQVARVIGGDGGGGGDGGVE